MLTRRLEFNPVRGGHARHIIAAADLTLRTEMFRINALQSGLPGGELMASVLAIHAAHIPTRQAITDINARATLRTVNPSVNNHTPPSAVPKSASNQSNHGPDSADEICRLFGEGKCR